MMIVSFVCPSAPEPMGGVVAMYEFANGLARRGHEVHIAHGAFWGRAGIRNLTDIPWFRFEHEIVHHFGEGEIPLPSADIIFGSGAPPHLGLPVVLVQGLDMFPETLERATFRSPCLKVCVASWLVDAGRRYGVPAEQLVHVRMGIDHDRYRLVTPVDEREAVVGILFNTHQAKGWAPGLAALTRVRARNPRLRVVAFGTERPSAALPAWIDFVHDPSPEVLVRDIYNRCRVFLQPSFWEGFGFTSVEAMACGAALVSTDNGGSRDYAFDGRTALVVAPGDVDAMAGGIERLLVDDDLHHHIATHGRDHVRGFRWDSAAEELEHHLLAYLADPARFRRPSAN